MKLKFKEIKLIIKCIKLYRDILLDTSVWETEEKDQKELKKIDKIIKKLEGDVINV
ncbi:MAG: hypothetical protein MSA89_07595 [Clostridium sp.]|nr:hypothetical protein [Clostridium sp.]